MELTAESRLIEELNSNKNIGPNSSFFQVSVLQLLTSTKEINTRTCDIENDIKVIEKDLQITLEQEKSARSTNDRYIMSIQKVQSEMNECKEKEISFLEAKKIKKEMIDEYVVKTEKLRDRIQQGSGWAEDQLQQRSNLTEEIKQAKFNVEDILSNTENIKNDVSTMKKTVKLAEEKRTEIGQEIEFLQSKINDKKEAVNINMRLKHSYDDQMKTLKEEVEEWSAELSTKEYILENTQKGVHDVEMGLKNLKLKMDSCLNENNKISNDMKEISKNMLKQMTTNEQLGTYNNDHIKSISAKSIEIQKLKKESAKLKKRSELLAEKILDVEKENLLFQNETQKICLEMNQNDEPIKMKKEAEMLSRQLEGLKRELEILNRNMKLSLKGEVNISILSELNDKKLNDLKQEFITGKRMIAENQQTISKLKLEIEKHCQQVETSTKNHQQAINILVQKEERIKDLQEKQLDFEKLLREQKCTYKLVITEGNEQSKILMQVHLDIRKYKREFEWACQEVEKSKQNITKVENSLVMEHFYHYSVDRDNECLEKEVEKVKHLVSQFKHLENKYEDEIQDLNRIINVADAEIMHQKKEYGNILVDRDCLESQFMKQSESLQKVYQKMKLQRHALLLGEGHYKKKLNEANVITESLSNLQKQKSELGNDLVSNHRILHRRCIALERAVTQQKIQNRAFQDDYDQTFNIHLWRKLEHSDPHRFELLERIQSLQRRIIVTSDETVAKENLIKEKEKKYIELKQHMTSGRQTKLSELQEHFEVYQSSLKDKTKQMKKMDVNLEHFKTRVLQLRKELLDITNKKKELNNLWVQSNFSEDVEIDRTI